MTDTRWGLLFCLVTVGCGGLAPSDAGAGGGTTMGGATSASGATGAVSQAGMAGCIWEGKAYAAGDIIIQWSQCDSCRCFGNNRTDCDRERSMLLITPPCNYANGNWYEDSVVPATDSCNSCTCRTVRTSDCSSKTEMSCSALDCTGSCSYAGRFYASGTSFPSTDGCNQCTCSNGVVDCTKNDCSCDTDQYWRLYRLTDARQCAEAVLDCPVGTSEFTNACGCGCEQSPDCPKRGQCVRVAAGDTAVNAWAIPTFPSDCTLPTVCPLSVANAILK